MSKNKMPKGWWNSKENCHTVALLCKTRIEFSKRFGGAYKASLRNEWIDEVCSHMELQQLPNGHWLYNKTNCEEKARLCDSRSEFYSRFGGAYNAASENNWLDEICDHMNEKHLPDGYWVNNKVNCQNAALQCRTRSEFQKTFPSAYNAAFENNWVEELCEHMDFTQYPKYYWDDKELCRNCANQCKSRTEFSKIFRSAYVSALRNNWLDEICTHMPKLGNLQNRCVYKIVDELKKDIYIGYTHDFYERDHKSQPKVYELRQRPTSEYLQLTDYLPIGLADEFEKAYIAYYKEHPEWECFNILDGGQR